MMVSAPPRVHLEGSGRTITAKEQPARGTTSACRLGRLGGGELFPPVGGLEYLPQPLDEVRLGIIELPAPAFVQLDEMGTTPVGEVAPARGDRIRG